MRRTGIGSDCATAAGLGLVLTLPLAWMGRGQLAHFVLVGAACVLVALPCAVLGGILLRVGSGTPVRTKASRLLCALSVLIATQIASLPAGAYLLAADVREARAFCDALALALEHERKASGAYPMTLDGSRQAERRPYLLRGQDIYVSDGRSFVLSFTERNALVPRTHLYSSEPKAWITF